MKVLDFTPSTNHAIVGLPLALAVALLSGCASNEAGAPTAQAPVATVATSPGIAPVPAPAANPSAPKNAGVPKSDVVGRNFDLGSIVRVEQVGGVPVIILDRWTSNEIPDDSTLAAKGVAMTSHTDVAFENVNGRVTYRIPVAQGAVFTHLGCNLERDPLKSPSTLEEFARFKGTPNEVILLTLDKQGRAIKALNDPGC